MASGSAGELLRTPENPQQSTFLELFFDLVSVVALFQLSHGLVRDLSWSNAFHTLVLLLAMWWVWYMTAANTDTFDPQRPAIQLLVIGILVSSLVLAAALPTAFGKRGPIFASVYVAIQIGRSLFFLVALRGNKLQRTAARVLLWAGVSAVPWIVGAFLSVTARGVLWAVAIAVDYFGYALRFPIAGWGRAPMSALPSVAEHLAERYRQFFIIALGELILVTGLALSDGGFGPDHTAAFLVSITTTVLLWRIYIYRAGQLLSAAIAAAPNPVRLGLLASYAHLAMVAGIVVTAVGADLVSSHPSGHTHPSWAAVILGGPALFLAGRARFEYVVLTRVSGDRPIGLVLLAALAPVMLLVPPLLAAIVPTAILAGIAVFDASRSASRLPHPPSPGRPP